MKADDLIGFDLGLAFETPAHRRGVEAASQAVFATVLEARLGFERTIREVGANGSFESTLLQLGREPERTRFMKDLQGPAPLTPF